LDFSQCCEALQFHTLISAGTTAARFAASVCTSAAWLAAGVAAASLLASAAGTHLGQQAATLLAAAIAATRFAAVIGTTAAGLAARISSTAGRFASSGTIVGTTAAGLFAACIGTTTGRFAAASLLACTTGLQPGEQATTLLAAAIAARLAAAVVGTATAGLTCIGTTARWLTATVVGTTTAWLGTTTKQAERLGVRGTAQHDCDAQAKRRQENITLHLGGS
jgi:hypothetical protein